MTRVFKRTWWRVAICRWQGHCYADDTRPPINVCDFCGGDL